MKGSDSPLVSAIALNAIFGNVPKFSHHLIDALGSAGAVFDLTPQERLEIFGPHNPHAAQIGPAALDAAQAEYERLSALGVQFLDIFAEGYPEALRECPDAPLLLYVRSATPAAELFGRRPAVAVVGTRDQSPYGRECCRRIVSALAQAPARPLVVSGLALGVDITAHAAALEGGLPTVGVSPVGVEEVYPRRHLAFVERMCSVPGCALVTDYPPGTVPTAFNFLRRNRIIAGLSAATVLIESKRKGGGLITADFAFNYNRDVYALPGRVDDPRSEGCNILIRKRVADAITDPETLMEDLGLGLPVRRAAAFIRDEIRSLYEGTMSPGEVDFLIAVAECIKKDRGITPDRIAARMGCDYSRVATATGLLEADGIIETDLLQGCGIKTKIG